MEALEIINLLNNSSNEPSKFATKKWCVIDNHTRTKVKYNENNYIKFETNTTKSNLCDNYDACIPVTGDKMVTGARVDTYVVQKIVNRDVECRM